MGDHGGEGGGKVDGGTMASNTSSTHHDHDFHNKLEGNQDHQPQPEMGPQYDTMGHFILKTLLYLVQEEDIKDPAIQ